MNKTLLINGSYRDGFSYKVLKEIESKVSDTTLIRLKDYNLKYCTGCLFCDKNGRCAINDDLDRILDLIRENNTIVFAIPNYFGGMSGFFKNFIDRMHFTYKNSIYRDKKIIFIYTGALEDDSITLRQLTESTKYLEGYLEFNVIGRFSFSSRKELDLNKVNDIVSLLNKGE